MEIFIFVNLWLFRRLFGHTNSLSFSPPSLILPPYFTLALPLLRLPLILSPFTHPSSIFYSCSPSPPPPSHSHPFTHPSSIFYSCSPSPPPPSHSHPFTHPSSIFYSCSPSPPPPSHSHPFTHPSSIFYSCSPSPPPSHSLPLHSSFLHILLLLSLSASLSLSPSRCLLACLTPLLYPCLCGWWPVYGNWDGYFLYETVAVFVGRRRRKATAEVLTGSCWRVCLSWHLALYLLPYLPSTSPCHSSWLWSGYRSSFSWGLLTAGTLTCTRKHADRHTHAVIKYAHAILTHAHMPTVDYLKM